MTYSILLYQTTGETQFVYEAETLEEITKLWEECKNEQDEYTSFDAELILYKDDEVIDSYNIPDNQREWITID